MVPIILEVLDASLIQLRRRVIVDDRRVAGDTQQSCGVLGSVEYAGGDEKAAG
jgi:hypothetical protein